MQWHVREMVWYMRIFVVAQYLWPRVTCEFDYENK